LRSMNSALTMRTGSKPECWKNRLSSIEITACTRTGGISSYRTRRRFSRFLSYKLLSNCGSRAYSVRGELSLSPVIDEILLIGKWSVCKLFVGEPGVLGVAGRDENNRGHRDANGTEEESRF